MRGLALGAVLVVLVTLAVGCTRETAPVPPTVAARPAVYDLGWAEPTPETGPGLVFRVRSFRVTPSGWRAEVAIENRTAIPWEIPSGNEAYQRAFGVMMFATGDLDELDRRNKDGDLPAIREPIRVTPELPSFLDPNTTWSARLDGAGPLPAGRFVRLVFGPLIAVGDAPEGMPATLVWITDSAVELR
jgi:hypothetical protein